MSKAIQATRRSFLKLGGAVALVSTLDPSAKPPPPRLPSPPLHPPPHPSSSWPTPSRALTPPCSSPAATPCPSSPFPSPWPTGRSSPAAATTGSFQPRDQRLQGIRCTHQLAVWLGDYGHATFLPFAGDPSPDPAARASSYRANELEIAPHSLKTTLLRYRCTLELAPTERCAAMRITFAESGPAGVFIDLPRRRRRSRI